MTGILASVSNQDEAKLILNTSINIIDLKQPELGALGALTTETVNQIVKLVNHKKPISATVGDLPMQPDVVFNAVNSMVKTGVDYIKIGFFTGGDCEGTLNKLTKISAQGYQLIAVLFADTYPDFRIIEFLKVAGFTGVMLDTQDKSKGSLSQVMPFPRIQEFVDTANHWNLLCGLAGSLSINDIPSLQILNIDYLGFRGALCEQNNRNARLDPDSINSIISLFEESLA